MNGSNLPVRAGPRAAFSSLAFACVLLLARTPTRTARVVLGLMLLQFVLGIADVLLLAPTWIQVVHLLGADLFWVALVALAAENLWPQSRTPQPNPVAV